ncbi:MAG: ROK family protein [Rhizobiaceae bacterium]
MLACFDIGGSFIKAAFASAPGDIVETGKAPTPLHDFDAFAAAMTNLIAAMPVSPLAVSVATTGVIDPQTGLMNCANIPAIHGTRFAVQLAAAVGLPVFAANDADCFALTEALDGAGRGHRTVFGIILGTGVGGGLIVDGRIITGPGGYAGEWGHGTALQTRAGDPPVDVPHFACGCGRFGCVDSVGGARGLERLHLNLHAEDADSAAIVKQWTGGDVRSSRTMNIYLDLVSTPLALVLNSVGATVVPVGGGLGTSAELVAALDEQVRAKMLYRTPEPLLRMAQQQLNPALNGAALLGFSELSRG